MLVFFSENIATHQKITAINRSLCHGKAYLLLQSTYTPICMPRLLPCDAAPARALCIFIRVVRCTCSTTKLLQFRIKAIIWAIIEMTVAGSIISSASSREPAAVTTMNKKKGHIIQCRHRMQPNQPLIYALGHVRSINRHVQFCVFFCLFRSVASAWDERARGKPSQIRNYNSRLGYMYTIRQLAVGPVPWPEGWQAAHTNLHTQDNILIMNFNWCGVCIYSPRDNSPNAHNCIPRHIYIIYILKCVMPHY